MTITNDFGQSDSDRVGIVVVPRLQQAAAIGSTFVLDRLKPQKLLNAPLTAGNLRLPESVENRMTYLGLWLSVLAAQPIWNVTPGEAVDTTLRLDEVRALVGYVELQSETVLTEMSAKYLQRGFTATAAAVAGKHPLLAAQLQSLLADKTVLPLQVADFDTSTSTSTSTSTPVAYRLLRQTEDGERVSIQLTTAAEAEAQAVELLLNLEGQRVMDAVEIAAASLVLLHHDDLGW